MNSRNPFKLGCAAIILVVVLRIAIGWHFLYEGVHKFNPAAQFSSEGFLGIAKGMTAEFFYWMLPDIDGVQRLELKKVKDEQNKEVDSFIVYENAWKNYYREYLAKHVPSLGKADTEAVINLYFAEGIAGFVRDYKREHANATDDDANNAWKEYLKNRLQEPASSLDDKEIGRITQTVIDTKNTWKEYCKVYLSQYVPADDVEAVANFYLSDDAAAFAQKIKKYWTDQSSVSAEDAEAIVKFCGTKEAGDLKEFLSKDIASVSTADVIVNLYAPKFAEQRAEDLVKNAAEVKTLIKSKVIFNRYLASLRAGATDTKEDVVAFVESRKRFQENNNAVRNDAVFEQERRWNRMMILRFEAAGWTRMIGAMSDGLQSDLGRAASADLAGQKGEIVPAPMQEFFSPNKLNATLTVPRIELSLPGYNLSIKSRMDALDAMVMFGLSAIGLCMILGFCNRLACLGGAAFLVFVALTTYPVPGVYPEIPSMVGNFMFVSKDVVELIALLFLAVIPAGRWGGLDYFLWHCGGKQIVGVICYPFRSHTEENPLPYKP